MGYLSIDELLDEMTLLLGLSQRLQAAGVVDEACSRMLAGWLRRHARGQQPWRRVDGAGASTAAPAALRQMFVSRVSALLPRIRDDQLHADLRACRDRLRAHPSA